MDQCVSLNYTVEIGEFHERDKFSWTEMRPNAEQSLEGLKKIKNLDFDFKMNHIK